MIEIRPIRPHEWAQAKRLIHEVLHIAFEDPRPLDEAIAERESRGGLKDLDEIQKLYFDTGGTFLVVTDDDQIVGTGAIRQLDGRICELKRLFVRFEYQGTGLGYRLTMELLRIARELGYEKMRLETAPRYLKRATAFYLRLGFYEIPPYRPIHPNDIAMELIL